MTKKFKQNLAIAIGISFLSFIGISVLKNLDWRNISDKVGEVSYDDKDYHAFRNYTFLGKNHFNYKFSYPGDFYLLAPNEVREEYYGYSADQETLLTYYRVFNKDSLIYKLEPDEDFSNPEFNKRENEFKDLVRLFP